MTADASYQERESPLKDENYWSALLEQEESLAPPNVPAPTEEAWSTITPHSNGRHAPSPSPQPENSWDTVRRYQKEDERVELTVIGYNKGGLIVDWNDLPGFVPASQLLDFPQFHLERRRTLALKKWVGKTLMLKIIEVNESANRLILSERAAQVEAKDRRALLRRLEPGDKTEGTVTNLTDFGVFVDLGGVEGLIHVSELSWSRVNHPSQILRPGQTVKVLVLDVAEKDGRIALSHKRLRRNPWQEVEKRYHPGQTVEGTVSNIVHFGAFVKLEEELEGLIHISELAEGTFLHPRNVVRKGDTVTARVLHVNGPKKRIALSLRRMANPTDNNR